MCALAGVMTQGQTGAYPRENPVPTETCAGKLAVAFQVEMDNIKVGGVGFLVAMLIMYLVC